MKAWLRRFLILTALMLIAVLAFFARPAFYLSNASRYELDQRTPVPVGHVDDASRLNLTAVAETWRIPVDQAEPERQLARLLSRARQENLKVAIAGARHSMGGHTIYPGGIAIDMLPWNKMQLDQQRNILHVQSGALWRDVIAYLDPLGKSVAIMQSNNAFSVGGSISVNCHGWQYDRPPIASTVESFRIMLADGSITHCSRTENAKLFSLALGGYGLFGIILDVELRVVPNERYRLHQFVVPANEALATLEGEITERSNAQMVFGRMNITPAELFEEVIINSFCTEDGEIPPVTAAGTARLRRAVFRGSGDDDYGKKLRWSMETHIQPMVAGKIFSRNQLLNEGVELFENRSATSTDILHEYFVPRKRAPVFVLAMKQILQHHNENLLNVTVRAVNEDHDTFLRYANQQMLAFVMLFIQERTDEGELQMQRLTGELIACALRHGGTYYLPYRLHASPEQFHQAYPMAERFFELKRKFDPNELFQNQLYVRYGAATSG